MRILPQTSRTVFAFLLSLQKPNLRPVSRSYFGRGEGLTSTGTKNLPPLAEPSLLLRKPNKWPATYHPGQDKTRIPSPFWAVFQKRPSPVTFGQEPWTRLPPVLSPLM